MAKEKKQYDVHIVIKGAQKVVIKDVTESKYMSLCMEIASKGYFDKEGNSIEFYPPSAIKFVSYKVAE